MFTPYIGAELDYGWYGTAKIAVVEQGIPINAEAKSDGYSGTWMVDKNIGVRAEYEARKYKVESESDTLGLFSIGVQYHF